MTRDCRWSNPCCVHVCVCVCVCEGRNELYRTTLHAAVLLRSSLLPSETAKSNNYGGSLLHDTSLLFLSSLVPRLHSPM